MLNSGPTSPAAGLSAEYCEYYSPAFIAGWAAYMAAFFFVAPTAKPRAIVYIDGFNLYYGSLRGTRNKWLDLEKVFDRLRQADEVVEIVYFTALVHGTASQADQQTYLSALARACPRVKVVLGKFKWTEVVCTVRKCRYPGDHRFRKTEEKRTDVNIAVRMLDDAYQDRCDRLVLVSGDSDLVPPIELIRHRFPEKRVVVYVPSNDPVRGAAVEIRGAANMDRTLPAALLKRCQLPPTIPDGPDGPIEKPAGW